GLGIGSPAEPLILADWTKLYIYLLPETTKGPEVLSRGPQCSDVLSRITRWGLIPLKGVPVPVSYSPLGPPLTCVGVRSLISQHAAVLALLPVLMKPVPPMPPLRHYSPLAYGSIRSAACSRSRESIHSPWHQPGEFRIFSADSWRRSLISFSAASSAS